MNIELRLALSLSHPRGKLRTHTDICHTPISRLCHVSASLHNRCLSRHSLLCWIIKKIWKKWTMFTRRPIFAVRAKYASLIQPKPHKNHNFKNEDTFTLLLLRKWTHSITAMQAFPRFRNESSKKLWRRVSLPFCKHLDFRAGIYRIVSCNLYV